MIINNLAEIDKDILRLIQMYPCLREEQVIATFNANQERKVKNGIRVLNKTGRLVRDENGFIKQNILIKPRDYQGLMVAYWVFLKFTKDINFMNSYLASYPSNIIFLKDDSQYKITYIEKDSEFLVNKMMQDDIKKQEEFGEIDLSIKHILVISSMDSLQKIINYINAYNIDKSKTSILIVYSDISNGLSENPEMKMFKVD